jgi:polysaccharide pyruvyl transferase WcaK-like protein
MNRRELLTLSTLPLAAALDRAAAAGKRPRHILLRSSWQTVNIGDIGHTPGLLRILEQHLPDVQVTLWPSSVDRGVGDMLLKVFPKLKIAEGKVDAAGRPLTPALEAAFREADLLVHGSGPSVVAQPDLRAWREVTGKPYGIYGVTVGAVDAPLRSLLSGAAFVYCRDTASLALIKAKGVAAPVMEFAPDATFAIHLRDDRRAAKYLQAHDLEARKFLCVIPRLRWTPYYKIRQKAPTAQDLEREAYSERFKEEDHAKLREVIIAWVRKTGLRVLACPEMTYQVPLAKELLVDPLPEDVKRSVVWRDTYWLPDEAASVYAQARAVVSFEMHSPIICAANGTPAFYLRQPTDTSKGQMWRDIGLQEWIFEIEPTRGAEIADTLLRVHADYEGAQARLEKAMRFVRERQRVTMQVVGASA